MKAIFAPKYNKRYGEIPIKLSEIPEVITLWAAGECNFRCKYCIQSSTLQIKKEEKFPVNKIMSWETFLRTMKQIQEFGKTLPAIVFCGIGEPLLNFRLADMISYIKQNHISQKVELVTNASLLTEEYSLKLIESGLDLMSVSIQGVTSEQYLETCGVACEVEQIAKQLKFFSEHKKECQLYIKTVDVALKSKEEYQRFEDLFGDIADFIFVDHVFPLFKNVDYSEFIQEEVDQYTGEPLKKQENFPCALIFNALYIEPEGEVVPCCTSPVPVRFGSIYETTLKEIWNSEKRKKLLLNHLEKRRREYDACSKCVQPEILNTQKGIEKMGIDKLVQKLSVPGKI